MAMSIYSLFRPRAGDRLGLHLLAVWLFALATGASFYAHQFDRPLTATIIYLFGVTLIAGLEGLRGGIVAAVVASLSYNFFISIPNYRFSLSSLDELTPLIAFNIAALASALLAGRLRDRARAAELAEGRVVKLLEVSRTLQPAVRLGQIAEALPSLAASGTIELYEVRDGAAVPLQDGRSHSAVAAQLASGSTDRLSDQHRTAFRLEAAGTGFVLVVPAREGPTPLNDEAWSSAFLNLVGLAIERCLLLERLSEAELLRRSEEFKTTLLSSVSHDLRTPLSAISASATSLARFDADLPQETRMDLLAMIQEQCDRLNRYTSNLLNLGRLQAGLDHSLFVDCDVVEVLGAAIGKVRELGSGHEIRKVYDQPSAIVRADPVMLEQVFYNLLENAVRYSPNLMPIVIHVAREENDVVISVEDGGQGIAPADLPRVFDRFYRTQGTAGQEGSGLGLSIARGFIEAFDGSIAASRISEADGGTRITIRLPHRSGSL